MCKWFPKILRFGRDERGYSSVEFVIVATTFLTGFFWVFETGLIMTKKMMLERAMDMTVREMRLGTLTETAEIKDRICDLALVFKDCDDTLLLQSAIFDPDIGFDQTAVCIDREDPDAEVGTDPNYGLASETVHLRACVIIDPLMPYGIALFPGASAKGIPLYADAAFANEPT
ncbi:MAG: hypothetical protein GY947_00670 [Rhodobacteraceae bacterium]|nr:hypothetical protein [Paracoccaceae bacterium]